jgi:tetratricopeptide (TPR) repeat protein
MTAAQSSRIGRLIHGLLAVLLSCSALWAAAADARELSAKEINKRLSEAQRLIQQGKADVAIHDKLDPIIESYRSQYTKPDQKVYSAHSMMETLVYSAIDAGAAKEAGTAAPAQIVVLDGGWSDALSLKGFALVELEKLGEAKAAYEQALAVAPLNSAAWSELGNIYQNAKQWPEATHAFEEAESSANLVMEDNPHRPLYARALRGKAYVLTEQGRLDESEALYQKCLTINPDDTHAKSELDYIAGLRAKGATSQTPEPLPASDPKPDSESRP